jgi:hypothetical protein
MSQFVCETCAGAGWVCENHPDKPWLRPPVGCLCGVRAPCPRCNKFSAESRPEVSEQFETMEEVDDDLVKRKMN